MAWTLKNSAETIAIFSTLLSEFLESEIKSLKSPLKTNENTLSELFFRSVCLVN